MNLGVLGGGGVNPWMTNLMPNDLPETSLWWQQEQRQFMTSWHVVGITNIVLTVLLMEIGAIFGFFGAVCSTYASGECKKKKHT